MQLAIGDVIETSTGDVTDFGGLIEKLLPASVIYIGETHTSSEDHKAQLAILKRLQEKNKCIIVGMEMFPRWISCAKLSPSSSSMTR